MTTQHQLTVVGAPDPELKTSPILDEYGEESDALIQDVEGIPDCYFNNDIYDDRTYICSGSGERMQCQKGVWVQKGGCDPDNP